MRFAVVGTNFISREFVTAGRKLAGFSLAAVCSRRRETAEAFADSFGGARCLTSLEELAACGDVDAVYIASPNACHAAQAERMLRAGKHVLLEKPACPDREAFASLRALAGEKGLVLLAEPQIWYNLCKAVSIGSEWEISNNFIYRTSNSKKSFYVNPTLALKFSL